MRNAQLLQGQRRQQPARVPNLQAIREKHHLYAAVARVVAVRYRVDDGFGDDLRGNLISPGRADALRPRTHRPVDLAEHEVHGLIDQLEHRALVDLIRGDRLLDLRSVKARALDLGGDQEPLGRLPEQQYGGIGQPPLVQQVQMLQQPLGGNVFRQREVPGSARDADEEGHPFGVEIIQRRERTRLGPGRSSSTHAFDQSHAEMLSSRKCAILSRFAARLENSFSQTSLNRASTFRLIDS